MMGKGKSKKKVERNSENKFNTRDEKAGQDKQNKCNNELEKGLIQQDEGRVSKFSKRKVTSNWNRYEEPPEMDEIFDGEESIDETKSFEYIKTNTGDASSHFQFQEEREWQQSLTSDDDGNNELHLNLSQLAASLSSLNITDKLKLYKLDSEFKYCISNLMETRDVSSKEKLLSPMATKLPTWNFKGIESYKHLFDNSKYTKRMKHIPEKHLFKENLVADKELCMEKENQQHFIVNVPESVPELLDSEGILSELLIEEDTIASSSDHINNIHATKSSPESKQISADDLDLLLGTSISTDVILNVNDKSVEETSELDNWLDSILN